MDHHSVKLEKLQIVTRIEGIDVLVMSLIHREDCKLVMVMIVVSAGHFWAAAPNVHSPEHS